MLRDYYTHVLAYPDTLLTRFFGLHRVKPHGGRNVRFVVMGNLLCTDHAIHRRYDLKGSTFGRLTKAPFDPAKKILKDLDLEYTFQLDNGFAARLRAQLAADCVLLERLNIMDYSLLLGVHFQHKCAQRRSAHIVPRADTHVRRGGDKSQAAAGSSAQDRGKPPLGPSLTKARGARSFARTFGADAPLSIGVQRARRRLV